MNKECYEFPLSFAQQRLWFLDQLEGPSAVYTIRLPVRLTGALDGDELQAAVDFVVARHESLRTTFADHGGKPVQVINSAVDVPVQWHELSATNPDDIHARVGELAGVPFDLVTGPLLRVHVLRIATDEHLLLLLCHHIVSDAWSSGVLFRDLAGAYDALIAGETPQPGELPVQYADYTIWQRDWLDGLELSRQLKFWQAALAGAPADTALPTDRPRPLQQTYNGSRLTRVMPVDLTVALKSLAADHSCTLFMVLFAAYNVLLSRYTGQDDICVGTPIAGRRRTELEGLVGLFVNTLVLRTDLSGQPGFLEQLARVRRSALAAFAHQELPFEKLVEALQPVRDQGRSPLFQTMFILQNAPWEAQPIRGIDVEPGETGPAETAKFDLTVSVHEYEKQLWVNCEYNTDLFDESTLERLSGSFETLLQAIIKNPAQSIHELDLLSAEHPPQPVDATIGLARLYDESQTVHGLIVEQAQQTPDAVALEYDGQPWTYQKLNSRADALAECLVELLPHSASPVIAVCTERAPVMMTAVLGVLKSGAGYVPLDRAFPARRLGYMIEDSGAGILVTQTGVIDAIPAFDGAIVLLTDDGRIAEIRMPVVKRSENDLSGVPDKSIAYLIYTSGSTGLPKGVRIGHRAVVNFLLSMAREPGIAAGDRLLAVTTLSFDIAVLELLLPLTVGATVIIAPTETAGDGHALDALARDSRPTVMQATPATWRMLINAGWTGSPELRILCGGESLDRELATQLLASGRELWNLYGPTETTIWSTCEQITTTSVQKKITIGRPIDNTTTQVLDTGLRPVPPGVVGEMFIGGHGLADGYHGREELTSERFVADPAKPGGRLYRTGDRVRITTDGRLELLGRVDRQVKLRGFRIELGEIEAALSALAGVGEAAVVLVDERLVAYFVSTGVSTGVPAGAAFDEKALRAQLRNGLPEYMVPTLFVELDTLPLTPNGKIDRRRLPAPDRTALADALSARVAPSGPLEAALTGLFADVLGLADVGVTDHFFDIGGHSLLATQLVSRIRDVLDIELPLRALFDEPTVKGLAGRIAAEDSLDRRALALLNRGLNRGVNRAGRLVPRDERLHTLAPASLMQQRLWFLEQLEPGGGTYNLAWCLRLAGELERAALEAAVQALVVRHEVLRTTFVDTSGIPQQCVTDALGFDVEYSTLTDVTDANIEGNLKERLQALAKQPFALDRGPLMRVHVVATGDQEQALLVVIHHIIADGWSMSVLFGELATAYNAFRGGHDVEGEPPSWQPLPVQYADYAVWQRGRLSGTALTRQIDYWRAQLDGAPALLDLPTDRPRPAVQSHRGARVSRVMTAELAGAVNKLVRDEECTLFMVLVATFAAVLARYAGTHDVVVGTPIAGRGQTELEGLIGFFVNTLVLRTRLDGNPTFRELLARVRLSALDAYAHQDVPFEKLVDELSPERNTGRTPIFQVMFNLHNEPVQAAGFDALESTPVGIDRGLAKFDLTVSINESEQGLFAHFEYNSDLFAEDTIIELSDYYVQLLEAFVDDPDLRMNALPLLVVPDLTESPLSESAHEADTIVSRFIVQARRAPKAIAVRAGRRALSYGELNEQANTVAARLLSLTPISDPDAPRIGLMCSSGTSLVAGLIGILKAGCAWVPLDPSWPAVRLAAMVGDADLSAIVVDVEHAERALKLSEKSMAIAELDDVASADEPAVEIAADQLACIIYTSGSTGLPKGVMQTHRGVVTQVDRYARSLELVPADRLSGLSSYAYDASIQDILGALLNGASVCLYDVRGEALAEDTALVSAIVADGITVVHAAPSLYRYLFGGDLNCAHDLSAVRRVVLGGEPVRRSDFELYRSRFAHGTRFINGLGLTESTLALQFHADPDTRLIGQSVPVGDAVAGLHIDLINDDGEPGWYGEIVLTGTGVSPGYWRQPEQTAERFGPGPVLRTGDIGRRLPDGQIVHVGRRDEQLNIRGYRVEPGEIETALGALDGVADGVVTVVERHGEPWLVAYLAAAGNNRPDRADIRASLEMRLPDYMVPQAFEWLDVLPRLANGKIDRAALPAPRFVRETGAGLVPASNDLEEKLLAIWREVLQLEMLGVHDDFFALGGHSLLATRVIARVRDQLGIEVPLINLFEYPTIAGFGASITALHIREAVTGPGDALISVTR
jgi:amino acid adenylation domain-containing protein